MSQLWNDLKMTDCNHSREIDRFRVLSGTFPEQAEEIKKSLPYFTFCELSPRKHKTGNFFKIESFCIDVRNFPKESSLLKEWRLNLQTDRRIEMMFLSADGNTMHIFFKLRIPCKNEKKFRLFYRNFTLQFYKENHIKEDILSEACDPRRAIMISSDPDAFFRIGAKLIIFEDYLDNEWSVITNDNATPKKHKNVVTEENIAAIKNIMGKKSQDKAYRLSIKEITNRIDTNSKMLERELSKHGISLTPIKNQHGSVVISLYQGNSSLKYNLVIDNKGNHVLLPSLSQSGSVISKTAEEILKNFFAQILL